MVASKKGKKVSLLGNLKNSVGSLAKGVVTKVVDSFRKKPTYILRIPKGKPIGKVYYAVESSFDPITFTKRSDAREFKRLLGVSTSVIKADIIRREVTEEGFIPTYGDENVQKNT